MLAREEITHLLSAINQEGCGSELRLKEEECEELEVILEAHPEFWPTVLADTLGLLRRKLRWESIDRQAIPEALIGFFDAKVMRDKDPMDLARQIGHEIRSACDGCTCRC